MEILNVYKVVDIPTLPSWLLVLLLVGAGAFIVVGILQAADREYVKATVCFLLAIVCAVLLSSLKTYCKRNYAKERYEVKIDDTLSAIELFEDWDIIKQRGNIFVLERKEADE